MSITSDEGLILIPALLGNVELANINALTAQSLIQSIFVAEHGFDIIAVDVPQQAQSLIDVYVETRLVVLQDEPASIADAYG